MEGPSIRLAAEQLQPFVGRRVRNVRGNSRIGIERLRNETVRDIFGWGKHLVVQFDTFALRTHFLLWGTFAAVVKGTRVTGDYVRAGSPRLVLVFANGLLTIWSASLKFLESADARETYDFRMDVMSDEWDPKRTLRAMREHPDEEIGDVLLDQSIFAGVGNIIKNEVLFRTRVDPRTRVSCISATAQRAIVTDVRVFAFRFLELRRAFALRRNLDIYGRSVCPACAGHVARFSHGARRRRSYVCVACQRSPVAGTVAAKSPRRAQVCQRLT